MPVYAKHALVQDLCSRRMGVRSADREPRFDAVMAPLGVPLGEVCRQGAFHWNRRKRQAAPGAGQAPAA